MFFGAGLDSSSGENSAASFLGMVQGSGGSCFRFSICLIKAEREFYREQSGDFIEFIHAHTLALHLRLFENTTNKRKIAQLNPNLFSDYRGEGT